LILAVGRLVHKKGFHDLVKACRILVDHGVKFYCVIVGEGPEKGRLEDLIHNSGLEEYVALPGPVPQDRLLQDYYTNASLLVQPSVVSPDGDKDGIPTVIVEALAIGLPVVATEISGIGEAVIDEDTGLIVRPGDPEALAKTMEKLLADPERTRRLAEGGRRMVETRFNLANNAGLVIHLMKFSARGGVRMTGTTLRRRVGLKPLTELAEERSSVCSG
jgi:glycosyltransferase involved in cell wall biosynthesis